MPTTPGAGWAISMTSLPSSGSPSSRGSGASGPVGSSKAACIAASTAVESRRGSTATRAPTSTGLGTAAHTHIPTVMSRRASRYPPSACSSASLGARTPEAARRSTATWIPDPPQAQPGGPAPRHDTLWLVPGTVSARSARSGRATARSRARSRAAAARRMRSGSSWSAAPDMTPTPVILRTPLTAPSRLVISAAGTSPTRPPPTRQLAVTSPSGRAPVTPSPNSKTSRPSAASRVV